jgi:CopG family transcriptional regulator, nickel-responsive regulator
MKDPLVRFGVAIEGSLLGQLDALAEERGCTRSELLRDLARGAVGRAKVPKGVEAVGALTLVYDHHVRDLSRRLTDLQHELGDGVRSALHVHLSHDLCLEVIVMRGFSDQLQSIADRILAMRGVKQGGIEIIAGLPPTLTRAPHAHEHQHAHKHEHAHEHAAPPHAWRRRPRRTRRA